MRAMLLSMMVVGCARAEVPQGPAELRTLYRVAIPEQLPPHPRVFVTPADLQRIETDLKAGDAYTTAAVNQIVGDAAGLAGRPFADPPTAGTLAEAARLAQGYILSGNKAQGEAGRQRLLAVAKLYPTLKTTGSRGRLTESTLHEGPVAVNAAMAYDLLASGDLLSAAERQTIEQDLLRVMGWECGHRCGHANSSNWRTWAMCIVAATGFASGDRDLIEEAVNGVWDPDRNLYLYGAVQQLQHSVFADGIHWERCIGYTYYTASALMHVVEAAKNSGIDLWHAPIPSLMGPFPGSAPHEEYGPTGTRSLRDFLDAPFYFAFPGGDFARIGDSGTSQIGYHPLYEMAYAEFGDPKYAWLIRRERDRDDTGLAGWDVWTPSGKPRTELRDGAGRNKSKGFWIQCGAKDRAALVQNVSAGAAATEVGGWVKAVAMNGGSAHLRVNVGDQMYYSERVTKAGDWQRLVATIPAAADGQPRTLRVHVFLEGGAGEVIWDNLEVTAGGQMANGDLESAPIGGRGLDFWALVNGVKDVPAGEYDLTKDARIGLVGRHTAGQTLFPVGGFAVLRSNPADQDAPAVLLNYGPYGSGHDHPDRLHISVFGLGEVLCPDAGSWGYDNPMHLTWANQTIAHNTLTVDEVAQWPQGMSNSIWASESGDRRSVGKLRLFHPGKLFQAVRATCDTVYDGVTMDRSLALMPYGLVDVVRVTADKDRTFDLALHGQGTVEPEGQVVELPANPFTGRGYNHLENLRQAALDGPYRATFTAGERNVQVIGTARGAGTVFFADDPAKGQAATACIIARQTGPTATWVTIIEPFRGQPRVKDLQVQGVSLLGQLGGTALQVTVTHAGGMDRLLFADALDRPVELAGDAGQETAVAVP